MERYSSYMKFLHWLYFRWYQQIAERQGWALFRDRYPFAYAFHRHWTRTLGMPDNYQPWRAIDIWLILKRYHPLSILEFGSGQSTAQFAEYSRLNNPFVKLEVWEEELDYLNRVHDGLLEVGLNPNTIDSYQYPRFKKQIKPDAFGVVYDANTNVLYRYRDMVYVDGPTAEHKLPCMDVIRMLYAGIYPELIVVHGRFSTVRRLLRWKEYRLTEGFSFKKNQNPFTAPYFQHCVFERVYDYQR